MCAFPGEPGRTALVLTGDKGIGKGIFANNIVSLFGPHATVLNHAAQLTSKFSGHFEAKSLVFADDIGLMSATEQGTFRSMLTEPRLSVEPKGVDRYDIDNCLHFIMASNEAHVAWVTHDERRFFILKVSNVRARDEDYFRALLDEQTPGGPGRQRCCMTSKQRDISRFNPEAFPKTAGFEEHVVSSRSIRWLPCY